MTGSIRSRAAWVPDARAVVFALLTLFAFAGALPAHAQSQGQAPGGDPPSRVARLSEASGNVWLLNPDDNEWIGIDRNRPLTSGDRIATDNGAHAEVTLGTTTLRLGEATDLEIVQLDDTAYRLRLQSGSVALRVRGPLALAGFSLETGEGQFRVLALGHYRFDRFDQSSNLSVYSGRAVFERRGTALVVAAGQQAQFWLDAAGAAQYDMIAPTDDEFTAWNDERDRIESQPVVATRYVSPDMTGVGDLDRYGQWQQSADYGPLWIPASVPADWAPYSAGHWAWVRPWGWTWVDDAPWGFAPFHYGRWVNYRDRWCWAPGTYVAHPIYAPALVAWIGGASLGVSIGTAPVGWFPLAPHEVYVPSYRTSPRYVREINVTNVTNITNITTIVNNVNGAADRRHFANRKFANAVTVVPAAVMTAHQQVAPAAREYRGRPQYRSLIAETKVAAVVTRPPVATPPVESRVPARTAVPRPPIKEERSSGATAPRGRGAEARPPGEVGHRPGERPIPVPGSAGMVPPVAGTAPRPPNTARSPENVEPKFPSPRNSPAASMPPTAPVHLRNDGKRGGGTGEPQPSSRQSSAERAGVPPAGAFAPASPARHSEPAIRGGDESSGKPRSAEMSRPVEAPRAIEPARPVPQPRPAVQPSRPVERHDAAAQPPRAIEERRPPERAQPAEPPRAVTPPRETRARNPEPQRHDTKGEDKGKESTK